MPQILVVDDELLVRNFIAAALKNRGYGVLLASCAAEATMVFQRERGAIDLLLTEFALTDASGEALVSRLREKRRDLPVIYLTAESRVETKEPVLYKPFHAGTLFGIIGKHCCQHPQAA